MAFPTAINSQITDGVTQANVSVLSEAPAVALGNLYQSAAHAAGLALQNAVVAQQNMNAVAQAATSICVATLLGTGTSDLTPKQK